MPTDPIRHYDRITAAWTLILGEDFHHGLFAPGETDLQRATACLTETMAAAASPPAHPRIVDLGCGTGTQACWLSERFGAVQVVGVSTSAVGVAAGRRRSQAAGLSATVTFVEADARDSGLAAGVWDLVWLTESSQYLAPRPAMMRECARLLAPGGRMVLGDVVLTHPLTLRDLRRRHVDLDVLGDTFGDAVMGTTEEYTQAAQAAGLTVTALTDLSARVLPTFGQWRDHARRAGPSVSNLIGEEGLAGFIAGCDVMERFFAEDVIGYALMTADKPWEPARMLT
ncbi:MAG TPA: methyltransferase domain-containing protein [Solirubrobacteraceae bacterium]|nr:methyltransferase domain-containing protein [Solirubrobacteraceae bacterium]